jgi:hypothetical protein
MRNRACAAVGAAFLVGGWGGTQYAKEQQAAIEADRGRFDVWMTGVENSRYRFAPTRVIYTSGVIAMSLGSAALAFAVVLPRGTLVPPDEQPNA